MNGRNRASDLFERFVTGGEATIDEFIAEQISEELFIDYKRVTNDGSSSRLEQADKENLARAISGFGNSEGGVIVWGVDCRNDPQRGDVPVKKHPIKDVKRFLSYLEGATSGCTVSPHDGVRHHLIESPTSSEGFVITLIRPSMYAPHQCVVGKYRGRYYIRVGSNFEQAPHGLLASMFGRRPAPYIFHTWQIGGGISPGRSTEILRATTLPESSPYAICKFFIRNHGTTVARELYLNFAFSLPGPNCLLYPAPKRGWTHNQSMLDWQHVMAPEHYRLPPGAMVNPVSFQIFIEPPFVQQLWYEISFGCEYSQVARFTKAIPPDRLQNAYNVFVSSDKSNQAKFSFGRVVFGADEKSDYLDNFDSQPVIEESV